MNGLLSIKQKGFTLIEVALVMGIFAILAGFATVNLLEPQQSADLNTTTTSLIADLKQQQARSMLGQGNGSSALPHGIYIESGRYTLFAGSTYNSSDPLNFVVDLSPNVTLATTFPASQIVFSLASGEISSFISGSSSITLTAPGGADKNFNF